MTSKESVIPKHHHRLHVPESCLKLGALPSVQTHESKHRILKSGGILDAQRARFKQINMDLDDGTCCHQRGPPLGRQADRCKRTRCSCAMSSSVQATLPLDSTRHGSLMHACVATPWTSNWFAVHWQQFKGSGGGTVHADAVGPARVLQPSPRWLDVTSFLAI